MACVLRELCVFKSKHKLAALRMLNTRLTPGRSGGEKPGAAAPGAVSVCSHGGPGSQARGDWALAALAIPGLPGGGLLRCGRPEPKSGAQGQEQEQTQRPFAPQARLTGILFYPLGRQAVFLPRAR